MHLRVSHFLMQTCASSNLAKSCTSKIKSGNTLVLTLLCTSNHKHCLSSSSSWQTLMCCTDYCKGKYSKVEEQIALVFQLNRMTAESHISNSFLSLALVKTTIHTCASSTWVLSALHFFQTALVWILSRCPQVHSPIVTKTLPSSSTSKASFFSHGYTFFLFGFHLGRLSDDIRPDSYLWCTRKSLTSHVIRFLFKAH